MERPDLVIIYSPVGGGHKAAALATAEAAEKRGLSVEIVDTFAHAPKIVGDTYLRAHLTGQGSLPNYYGTAYFAANKRGGAFEPVRRTFDHAVFLDLLHYVCAKKPRAVIATHHLPLVVLGRARRKGWLAAPLHGVITDYTSHACWVEKGVDGFFASCERSRHELVLHGVDPRRIALTGIPIKSAFYEIPSVRNPAENEPVRVLMTSGGFGVGPLADIVRSFRGIENVELTVVCGNATDAIRRVSKEAKAIGIRAEVVGFEKNMAARVARAHVVVGKAGGLTVTETMAAGRPMLIVGAIPGNEKLNEDFVVRGGAGLAPEPSRVGAYVNAIRQGGLIEEMGACARGRVLRHSADRVLDAAGFRAAAPKAA
ncbi:MAG: MGDG synthase family glycosyltransferase [Polyangiaceae bacterium]